jgi:hypothetical protein
VQIEHSRQRRSFRVIVLNQVEILVLHR